MLDICGTKKRMHANDQEVDAIVEEGWVEDIERKQELVIHTSLPEKMTNCAHCGLCPSPHKCQPKEDGFVFRGVGIYQCQKCEELCDIQQKLNHDCKAPNLENSASSMDEDPDGGDSKEDNEMLSEFRARKKDPGAQLKPMQTRVISTLLSGKNVLCLDGTGAGKSEIYLLATILRRRGDPSAGPAMVFEPTIALANDQLKRAREFGLQAEIYPSLPAPGSPAAVIAKARSSIDTILGKIRSNRLDVLFITPEMWNSALQRHHHKLWNIFQFAKHPRMRPDQWNHLALLVIDEIHCIADQGSEFRPAYRSVWPGLAGYPWFDGALKLGLTATMTARAKQAVGEVLNIHTWQEESGDFRRNNLALRVLSGCPSEPARFDWLLGHINDNPTRNMLVFIPSIEKGQLWLRSLEEKGVDKVALYHSRIAGGDEILKSFQAGTTRVLLSTNALSQGWNKPDVHDVIHMWTPSMASQYNQEIGRAGRSPDIAARAYLISSRVWMNDKWMAALYRLVAFLNCCDGRSAPKRDVEDMLMQMRVNPQDIERAIQKGHELTILGSNFVPEQEGDHDLTSNIFLKSETAFEAILQSLESYRQERRKEMQSMQDLNNKPSCCWRHLLKWSCSQDLPGWKCQNCSGSECKPEGDILPDLYAGNEVCYHAMTPQGLQVYSLAQAGETPSYDIERLKDLFFKYTPEVAIDPPLWTFVFIPHLANEDAHKANAELIAEGLGLTVHECVLSDPQKKHLKMKGANNDAARKAVLDSGKLSLDLGKVPKFGNVLLYDNVMISGQTLDFIGMQLERRGLRVVCLVDCIYHTKRDCYSLY